MYRGKGKRVAVFSAAGIALLLMGMLPFLSGCAASQNGKETENVKQSVSGWTEEEGTPVACLGEKPIYLEEALFYTRMLQEQWEQAYYENFGSDMWEQEASEDGRTLEEMLKADVMSLLTELHLLENHAEEYGVQLTEEEQAVIADRAQNFMESNTQAVLEAAGATRESVECYLSRNELAGKTAEQIQNAYEPQLKEEDARVGKLTYCLFSTRGTYDLEGNHTPFTDEEILQIEQEAQQFAARAQELGDISAAGEEASHTAIDAYFNDSADGGVHPDVADAVRAMETGQVSDVIRTDDGWYVVQRVSDFDESATEDNLEAMIQQAKEEYLLELEAEWEKETPLVIEEEVWNGVRVDEILTEM